jgi:hypothetical protein
MYGSVCTGCLTWSVITLGIVKSFSVFENKLVKRKFGLKERIWEDSQVIPVMLFILCIVLVVIYIYQQACK